MNWILRSWAHLLHRATLDICGAVLDYDQAYCFNLSAIICYIILTFAFGMTGKLHQAKMHCQFPLNFCWIWWSRFNSLDGYWWKVEFVINFLPSIDIFLCWFLMDCVPLCETQQQIISCLSRCNALYWTKRYAGNWKFWSYWLKECNSSDFSLDSLAWEPVHYRYLQHLCKWVSPTKIVIPLVICDSKLRGLVSIE